MSFRHRFTATAFATLCGSLLLPAATAEAAPPRPGIAVSGRASTGHVAIGGSVELSGRVTAAGSGHPVPVTVLAHTAGGPAGYQKVAQVLADADADYRITVKPRANTSYIAEVGGFLARAASEPVEVTVDRTITLDAPPQAPDDRSAVFSGTVTGGGRQPVELQRLDGDQWRAVASASTDDTGHFAIPVRLDHRTATRWRATAPATAALGPGTSPALLVRPS